MGNTLLNRTDAGVLVTGGLLLSSANAEAHGNGGRNGLTRNNALDYLEKAVGLILGEVTA